LTDQGSSPLESAALLLILVLPVAPALGLYQHLGDLLAAESIARHGLRAAVLSHEKGEVPASLQEVLDPLAKGWGKSLSGFSLRCLGSCEDPGILSLTVLVGSATATQSAGLEPK